MNQQTEREQLEDVLHAYQEASPNYAMLNEWIRRYPYYEQELTDFTVAHNLIQALPEPLVSEQAESELITFGKSVIQSLMGTAQVNREPTPARLASLLEAGKVVGLKLPDIAKRMRLGVALVRKLDRRLVRFSTLPREVIEELARVLQQDAYTIARYLQLPPTLAQGANYRSDQTPQLAEPEEFVAAIKADLAISKEDRDYWLEKTLNT